MTGKEGGSRSYRGTFPLAVEASQFDFERSHLLGFGVVLLLLRFGRRFGLLTCIRTCGGTKKMASAVNMGWKKKKERKNSTVNVLSSGKEASPFPSFVLALRSGGGGGCGVSTTTGGAAATGATSATMVSTAAGTLAVASAALAAAAPLKGLLVLNSRHLAPRTIIILDTAILGFLAAMRGLEVKEGQF